MKSLSNEWPEGYFALYGAIADDSFAAPEPIEPNADAPREEL